MKYFKQLLTISCFLLTAAYAAISPHDAARKGDLQTLRDYRFNGMDLYLPDERGFTPYELAALNADPDKPGKVQQHVELMLWLKEFHSPQHRYGKASIQLVQAGLRALGYNVSQPDGIMGENTAKAIRAYQGDNGLATTGRLGPQWLGVFFQDVLKDVQYKLTKLGFDTKGTDGLMGRNTKRAFVKYRHANHLSQPDYEYLDALLVMSANTALNQREKAQKAAKAKQEREQEQQQNRYIQAGLSALGYRIGKIDGMFGSKTANAIKAFQKKYGLDIDGEAGPTTLQKMHTVFLKNTQYQLNAIGYQVGKPDGLTGSKTQKAILHYRQKHQLPQRAANDAMLMQSLRHTYITRKEQQQAKARAAKAKQAESQVQQGNIRFAQAGLRTLGYIKDIDGVIGPDTDKAIKRFQKRYNIPTNGKLGPMTMGKMQSIFLKESQRKLNVMGYAVGKPDGQMGSATRKAIKSFAKRYKTTSTFGTTLIAAIDDAYDGRRGSKSSAKKQTAKSSKQSRLNKLNKSVAKNAKKTAKKQSEATKKRATAIAKKRPSKDVVKRPSKSASVKKPSSSGSKATRSVDSRHASGRMTFNRKGGRVVGCSLAGRRIPIEWCEPFYPLPRKNHCKATFKPSNGKVINLWCK